jgi:hypothetical protein
MAWAIVHGGKDVENRSSSARRQFKPAVGKRVLILASKGMTAAEYENAVAFMASIGVRCPQRGALQFGGVIGSVFVRDIVTRSDSPWSERARPLSCSPTQSRSRSRRCAARPACFGSEQDQDRHHRRGVRRARIHAAVRLSGLREGTRRQWRMRRVTGATRWSTGFGPCAVGANLFPTSSSSRRLRREARQTRAPCNHSFVGHRRRARPQHACCEWCCAGLLLHVAADRHLPESERLYAHRVSVAGHDLWPGQRRRPLDDDAPA